MPNVEWHRKTLMKLLIKQALLVPMYFLAPVLIAGILAADYSAISQHASEITLTLHIYGYCFNGIDENVPEFFGQLTPLNGLSICIL